MSKICLDSGVSSIFFTKNPTPQVKMLMGEIQKQSIQAFLPKPVLIEAFYHVCKNDGKDIAKITLIKFLKKYPLHLIEFDTNLLLHAGQLKCQHRSTLSYIDCMGIAVALKYVMNRSSPEKKVKKIPHNVLDRLKVVTYAF